MTTGNRYQSSLSSRAMFSSDTNLSSGTVITSWSSNRLNKAKQTFSPMDPTDDSIFTAGLDDVTTMSKILHELHHAGEHSVLVITKEGIRLVSADEKSFQVSAYFSASTFQRFKFEPGKDDNPLQCTFRFILKDFIECLNLLRDDPIVEGDKIQLDESNTGDIMKTSLYIQYRKKGEPLKLRLENKSNYVINCDLKAFSSSSDFSPISFSNYEEHAVIVLDSKRLYLYIAGLELSQCDFVHLVMGRGDKPLSFSAKASLLGSVELEIHANETDIIKKEIKVSDNCLFSFTYKSQHMRPALEALKNSTWVQMKCASNGILSIEHFPGPWPDKTTRDGNYVRADNGFLSSQSSFGFESNENKRSSVEYFIESEAKPIDVCPD